MLRNYRFVRANEQNETKTRKSECLTMPNEIDRYHVDGATLEENADGDDGVKRLRFHHLFARKRQFERPRHLGAQDVGPGYPAVDKRIDALPLHALDELAVPAPHTHAGSVGKNAPSVDREVLPNKVTCSDTRILKLLTETAGKYDSPSGPGSIMFQSVGVTRNVNSGVESLQQDRVSMDPTDAHQHVLTIPILNALATSFDGIGTWRPAHVHLKRCTCLM